MATRISGGGGGGGRNEGKGGGRQHDGQHRHPRQALRPTAKDDGVDSSCGASRSDHRGQGHHPVVIDWRFGWTSLSNASTAHAHRRCARATEPPASRPPHHRVGSPAWRPSRSPRPRPASVGHGWAGSRRRTVRSTRHSSCRSAPRPASRADTAGPAHRGYPDPAGQHLPPFLRPGHERIAALGGLHRFMGWDGPILTDSGGFQVFSLAHLRRGRRRRSDLRQPPRRLEPAADAGARDGDPGALGSATSRWRSTSWSMRPCRARQVAEAMARTHCWAERCLAAHTRADQARVRDRAGRRSTRRCDARVRRRLPACRFDGIAVGGLSVGESKDEMAATLDVVADALGDDPRPRYLMGVGSPPDFFAAVERGIDLFDCVLPTRVARNGQVWTDGGKLNLRNARFLDDPGPDRSGVRVRGVPQPLAGLPRPPVPRAGAARVSARLGP